MRLIHIEESEHKNEISYRKAKEILKIKPNVILFEYPIHEGSSLSDFNKFEPKEKPKQEIEGWKRGLAVSSKKYPWLKAEYKIIEAIEQLWIRGKQIYLFEIDGPVELTSLKGTKSQLNNIVWNYLREKYMIENIRKMEARINKKSIVMILCHNFHWKNIQFLLKKPQKEKIWDYYFVKNGITKSPRQIQHELKKQNKILYKYWKLKSDF